MELAMISRSTLRSFRRARPLARLCARCLLCVAGTVGAGDEYWVVGGTGQNIYFVPVAGQDFPNEHDGEFKVRKLTGEYYDPQSIAPITLDPTSGKTKNNRLPGDVAQSIAVSRTTPENARSASSSLSIGNRTARSGPS